MYSEAPIKQRIMKESKIIEKSPLLAALLAEVHAFCKARRGRIGELATALDVAQPQVSAWLNRRAAPSGEITLQMQAWLARELEASASSRAEKVAAAPVRLAAALRGVRS